MARSFSGYFPNRHHVSDLTCLGLVAVEKLLLVCPLVEMLINRQKCLRRDVIEIVIRNTNYKSLTIHFKPIVTSQWEERKLAVMNCLVKQRNCE